MNDFLTADTSSATNEKPYMNFETIEVTKQTLGSEEQSPIPVRLQVAWVYTDIRQWAIIKPSNPGKTVKNVDAIHLFHQIIEIGNSKTDEPFQKQITRYNASFVVDTKRTDSNSRYLVYRILTKNDFSAGVSLRYMPPNLIERLMLHKSITG